MLENNQKVVFITGASKGIGLETAILLAQHSYQVYGTYRHSKDYKELEVLSQSIGPNLIFKYLDLTKSSTIQKAIQEVIQEQNRIDVLINNAAYGLVGALETLTLDEIRHQLEVNLIGALAACQEVLPFMRQQGCGHIINISSTNGAYGIPYATLYAASKAALETVSEGLAIEVAPWNIDVSIIEPGLVDTKASFVMGSRSEQEEVYREKHQAIQDIQTARNQNIKKIGVPYQTPQQIASFIQTVIESPAPKLRYQTSSVAKEWVQVKLHDIDGQVTKTHLSRLFNEQPVKQNA